jgi:hypothetical protein
MPPFFWNCDVPVAISRMVLKVDALGYLNGQAELACHERD